MRTRKRSTSALLIWVLALSGTGAWLSGQLVKQHADLWGAGHARAGLFGRMCQAAERAGLSCAGAAQGPWSELQFPVPVVSSNLGLGVRTAVIPVAFLSLAYFVFMGTWFAFIGRPRPYGYGWHRIPLVLGMGGAMISLFYIGVMVFGAALGCVWCLAVHLVNFLMVHAIWRMGARVPDPELTSSASSPLQIARGILTSREVRSVVAFSLILIVGLWAYRRERLALQDRYYRLLPYRHLVTALRKDPEFLLREYRAQPRHEIPLRAGESLAAGQPRLVIFTDFECPACYCNMLTARRQATRTFNGQLVVSIRHYPLCSACNHDIRDEPHANACEAAYAAEAARLQGGEPAFEQMYTGLFQNSNRLGRDLYRELAEQIGLDANHLLQDMEDDSVRAIVAADVALARKLGVTGTPTMFLDGRRVTELCQGIVFWKAVAADLNGPRKDDPQPVAGIRDSLAANPAQNEPLP
jgi:hypothetical protein